MLRDIGFGVKFIKDYNELNILRYIKNSKDVSRAKIARTYKISKAAVSDIVYRLITQGYVSEIGVGNSTTKGGRKPVILKFNQLAGYVIGLEIKRSYARVALIDLDAHIHRMEIFNFERGTPLNLILDEAISIIEQFCSLEWAAGSKALGIGVAVPGIINYKSGCIQVSDTLKNWVNFPLKEYLEERVGIPTVIENDVKAQTLAEGLFGIGSKYSNMVYLWIGDGIGAGLIINGSLIRGISSSAGEIGYDELGFFVRDIQNYPLLYRGQKDFGDILSNKLILESAENALTNGYDTILCKNTLSIDSLVDAASQEDDLATALFSEFGNLLGTLCINLVNMLNMELLIIGGKLVYKNDLLLKFLRDKVNKDLLSTPAQAVKIVSASLKDEGGVLGAAGLVLQDLFYQDRINVMKYRDVFKSVPEATV